MMSLDSKGQYSVKTSLKVTHYFYYWENHSNDPIKVYGKLGAFPCNLPVDIP